MIMLLLSLSILIGSCGYSKECNGSPLQEYNKHKE